MKKIRIRALRRFKRIQRDFQRYKGKAAAKFQELVMEAQSFLDGIQDGQLKLSFRHR
ncbi:MAG: hypothetical protein ABRQ38_30245 [Candidatus Eremiobacterota bacterium]